MWIIKGHVSDVFLVASLSNIRRCQGMNRTKTFGYGVEIVSENKNTQTVLGPDCKIKGQITLEHDAIVMGEITGQIRVGGMLELTETSRVHGTVVAGGLRLGGKAKADVIAEHGMELLASAELTGHLYTTRLSVVDGAMFEGHVVVGPKAMDAAGDVAKEMDMEMPQADSDMVFTGSENASVGMPDVNTVPKSLDEILQRRRNKSNGQAVVAVEVE